MDKKYNIMGSEVVEGYRCKPVQRDPERPIMHFRHQIFLCTGKRCAGSAEADALTEMLRDLIEKTGLDRGDRRIKITRSNCFGACRFRRVAVIYENGSGAANNCVWLKQGHSLDRDAWQELLLHLRDGHPLIESRFAEILIPMEKVAEIPE